MSFLNTILLAGSLACVVPLMIHIFNRARSKPVDWGAMQFLEAALPTSSRHLQWESLLLLLVRMSIPVVLALCMARPVLTSFRAGAGSGARSIVVLIDNSLSMLTPVAEVGAESSSSSIQGYQGTSGTFLQVANSLRSELVAAFPSERFELLVTHDLARSSPDATVSSPATQQSNERVECSGASCDVVSRLETAIRTANALPSPSRHVIFISDFQHSTWQAVSGREQTAIRDLLNAEALPVQLTFMPVSSGASTPRNLAIHLAPRPTASAFVSEAYSIQPRISNFGDAELPVRVTLSVDGQALESRTTNVLPGTPAQLGFACTFNQAGWHHLSVEIDDGQGMPSDNRAFEVVNVVDSLRVIIVDGQAPHDDLESSPADYLRLALAPFQADDGQRNHFQVASIAPSQLTAERVVNADAILLYDVPRLDTRQIALLHGFVAGGGGLIVFAGEHLDLPWYNEQLHADKDLLPLPYVERRQTVEPRRAVVPANALYTLDGTSLAGNPLDSVEFTRWLRIDEAKPSSTDSPAASALHEKGPSQGSIAPERWLQLVDGELLIAAHAYGSGRVVQSGIGLDEDWTNLPLRPAFVPLLQQLVLACTSAISVPHNVYCGEVSYEALQDQRRLVPGIFEVAAAQRQEIRQAPQLISTAMYPAESDPRCLGASELRELAQRCGANIADSCDEFVALDRQQREGKEIWRLLWLLVLVLVLGELLIAGRITRGAS